jgi:hypothetical protein
VAWREVLERIDDEIVAWVRTYKQTMGVPGVARARSSEGGEQTEFLEDETEAHPI